MNWLVRRVKCWLGFHGWLTDVKKLKEKLKEFEWKPGAILESPKICEYCKKRTLTHDP